MNHFAKFDLASLTVACARLLTLAALAFADANFAAEPNGRELAFAIQKGNCLACHRIPNDSQANTSADIGPVLENVKRRFPDRANLRAQIWDASVANPATVMPPYGRHKILSDTEIDKIVEYLYSM